MSTYKEILPGDIKTARSYMTQMVDVLQNDVSGSTSRKKYAVFVTGGVGPGVTSSLFQTVYDSDFTTQTSNAIMDMTVGIFEGGATELTSRTSTDAMGKNLYPSSSLMMREKCEIYKQFAQTLLGDATQQFTAPLDSSNVSDKVDVALFLCFKRLFHRDSIKRETFAMRFYQTASFIPYETAKDHIPNLNVTSISGSAIYTDVGAATNKIVAVGGEVGNIVDAANTANTIGLMFYDRGVALLDLAKITSSSQFMSGTVDAMHPAGRIDMGGPRSEAYAKSKFIPDFVVSGSIDNILDHIAACRFQSGSVSAMMFQNVTNINSTLVFCRANADEFNYSSNPTYIDSDNRIVVIDEGQESVQTAFSFVTSVGLYDASDNCLAVAKVSRPIENNNEKDLSLRVRLDF